jgi:sec-independent protein translocase protein TatA
MNMTFFAMLQWPEILGILIVVLILFGAKKLPELARGLGQGIKEFKRATRDVQDDLQRAIDDTDYDSAPPKNQSSSPVEAPPANPASTPDAASTEPADSEGNREAFLEGKDSSSKG